MLGYLSQPSVLHNLKLRYDANCIYVCGPFNFPLPFAPRLVLVS